jgi:hypothetical protein
MHPHPSCYSPGKVCPLNGTRYVNKFFLIRKTGHGTIGKTISDISEVICPKEPSLIFLHFVTEFRRGILVPAQRMTKETLSVLHMGHAVQILPALHK